MLKSLLVVAGIFVLEMAGSQAALAVTEPADIVGVYLYDEVKVDANGEATMSKYHKKWSEIKLAPANTALLNQYVQKLDRQGEEKFKVAFLTVSLSKSGDKVEGAAFYGDWGTVIMKDFVANSGHNVCELIYDSSGGPAGVTEKPCRWEN